MRIIVVGAGPVGLVLGSLLALDHQVRILEKRIAPGRDHGLNIDPAAIDALIHYLGPRTHPLVPTIIETLLSWRGHHVRTSEIEVQFEVYAQELGATIERGVTLEFLDQLRGAVIIGADGARSVIRTLTFDNDLVQVETVHHMAQLKFSTPGTTLPRSPVGAGLHSFINGVTGSDIVVDFESMSKQKSMGRKTGTLHIPIPHNVYQILSAEGRGRYETPWTLPDLALEASTSTAEGRDQVAKLMRVIRRYEIGLKWRGGWFENPRVTVLPLTMYRSRYVFTITPANRLFMLCGDASSGLIFEQGLGKGLLEAVQCAYTLSAPQPEIIAARLTEYGAYCRDLYDQKRRQIQAKYRKLIQTNVTTSALASVMGVGILGSIGTSIIR